MNEWNLTTLNYCLTVTPQKLIATARFFLHLVLPECQIVDCHMRP